MVVAGRASAAARFYELELQKLLIDFEKVALFTTHPTALGTYRERRLRQYLRDFTPMQLSLSTGFAVDPALDASDMSGPRSRQIDCLVYDETRRHPELRTDDYVVVRPEAMFAAIEVKSALTFYKEEMKVGGDPSHYPLSRFDVRFRWAGTLVDALRNVKSTRDVCRSRNNNIFFGVFGYAATFSWNTLYSALDNGDLQCQLGLNHVDDFPPVICVPAKFVINISPYDFLEQAPHHDPAVSHFNIVESTDEAPAYPLQFFTTYFLNSLGAALNGEMPRGGGINSGGSRAPVRIWSHHFDLDSKGHEDQ